MGLTGSIVFVVIEAPKPCSSSPGCCVAHNWVLAASVKDVKQLNKILAALGGNFKALQSKPSFTFGKWLPPSVLLEVFQAVHVSDSAANEASQHEFRLPPCYILRNTFTLLVSPDSIHAQS